MGKEQIAVVFKEFAPHGLTKPAFAKALQEFCTCAKPIAITNVFAIDKSETLRKLETGEMFEILEGPLDDAETQMSRVRGRALRDGLEGWCTVKGNQGTPFLKPSDKPFMSVSKAAALHKEADASSAVVKRLQPDEVLELVEGPRKETPPAELLLQGSASND